MSHLHDEGMSVPDHFFRRYFRHQPLALAAAARRELGFPIHVLVDSDGKRDTWIHAFVANQEAGFAIDVRGRLDLDPQVIGEGVPHYGELRIIETTLSDAVRHMDCFPEAADILEARAVLRAWVLPGIDLTPSAPRISM